MSSRPQGAAADAVERSEPLLRRCLGHFATGVAIVTYETPDGPRGLTVNSFTSVSLDPPLVLVCLDRRSKAAERLPLSAFAVNVLHADQRDLAWHFAGRPSPGLQPQWRRAHTAPRLSDCLAWLACEPWSSQDAGDHVIVVGRVAQFGTSEEAPLCFFRGEFLELAPRQQPPAPLP